MDRRFGFKDFVLAVLLVGVIVVVLLAMLQYDRQLERLNAIERTLQAHTRDLASIQRAIDRGVAVRRDSNQAQNAGADAGPSGGASSDGVDEHDAYPDPFARIRRAQASQGYARGDYLIDVFGVVPERLTPLISSDAYSSAVQDQVLQSLAVRHPDTLEWMPLLAERWRVSEDGLTIEFDMRSEAVFSDGEPVSVQDVVFTFNWIMNPDVEAPRARAYYQKIKDVSAVDGDTVRFVFNEPYFRAFEIAGGMQILPKHFYERFTASQFNRSTGLLLGSGPYRLADPESWRPEPGKPVELVRNERYWGPLAPFEKRIWRVIENDAARLTTFRNGDVDRFGPTPEQYEKLLDDEALVDRTQHYVYRSPTSGYLYIGWNQKRGGESTPFADRRVRRAMTMLIDRRRMVEDIYLGYGQVVTGPFNPLSKQYDDSIEPWPFDIDRAKALLAEAGFEDRDEDGVIEGPQGRAFAFELTYPANSDMHERLVLMARDSMAKAGVVLNPKPAEWSVLLQRIDERSFEAVMLGWTGSLEGDLYQIFHSDQAEPGGDNFISYTSDRLDRLIDRARRTVDESKRMPIWRQAHRTIHEDQPYTFLITRKSIVFLDDRLKNVERVKLGLNPAQEWYVPAPLRKWTK